MRKIFKPFLRNERGAVAIMFGLALVPLIGLIAAAVEYSRAGDAHSRLQAAVDSTALALSKLPATTTATDLTNQANLMVKAYVNDTSLNSNLAVTATRGTSTVTVTANGNMATPLVAILGTNSVKLSVDSTTVWGGTRLRVALALDNTGSMASSGKMTALKSAAQSLLTQLKNAATKDGDVYVSIIPFAKDVNVGASNYTQSWVKWTGSSDSWDQQNGSCSRSGSRYDTYAGCAGSGYTWTPASRKTWTGCVMDRDQSYDTTNTTPNASVAATLFPAEQYDAYCPEQLMGLTYDWTSLNNKITAMSPAGGTNQAIGLQWAYQSLTASPFTIPPTDPNYQYQNIIILLTDGLNTQNRIYGNGSDPSPQVDARQTILCNNVKASNIILYTVQVNTDGDPTSTMLRSCATDTSKFFLLTSSSQIVTTFTQIGTQLTALRVSK